ncbi:MAG: zf-HC2 domain-containing protein [Syntrophaceae bacterium]|nr:zf-HC2 domain-containing protein [Syntrophaceae bacterium]
MKNCKDIENKLSLYLDNEFFAQEKRAVEEHIKTCPQCSKALAELQKAKAMTNKLSEVEPPPWFKQKIMAKVRAEAQKKSFAEKWFYPLRVKIPVQVFATIFIVVIAVYIYRGGNEQFKEVMPPAATAPVLEEQKEELAVNQDMPAAVAARPTKKITEADKACEGNACEISELKAYDSPGETLSVAKGKQEPKTAASPMREKAIEAEDTVPRMKSSSMQAAMEKTESVVQPKQENNVIIIMTSEVQTAAAQVKKIIAEYSAAKVSKQLADGKVVFRTEISKEKLKDFIEKLKTIGVIEEKVSAVVTAEEQVPVVIEIQKN